MKKDSKGKKAVKKESKKTNNKKSHVVAQPAHQTAHQAENIAKPRPKTGIEAKVQLLEGRLLVEVSEVAQEKVTESGIILPSNMDSEAPRGTKGKVVAAGPGYADKEGKVTPLSVEVGDTIIFQEMDKVKIEEKEYHIIHEHDVWVILK